MQRIRKDEKIEGPNVRSSVDREVMPTRKKSCVLDVADNGPQLRVALAMLGELCRKDQKIEEPHASVRSRVVYIEQ